MKRIFKKWKEFKKKGKNISYRLRMVKTGRVACNGDSHVVLNVYVYVYSNFQSYFK